MKNNITLSVNQTKEEKRKLEYIGTIVPHTGHKIFKINEETLEVSAPQLVKKTWEFNGENKPEILIEEGFNYVSALNERNALKHHKNGTNGSKNIFKKPLKL